MDRTFTQQLDNLGLKMISDIQVKYEQLSAKQKEIFAGYGLRQVKHFVEISLPITGYKQPRVIEFRAEMPKTPVGKILRRELRDKK